ncbi:phosphoenolpyruvate--protein phosphotransferase [Alkalimarinus sediminis]|uniref:phosphoenolpyruvate--protein phosphotransferase n=1 Tax=Alkalimarinus sediminis TaxID=1632866 RepID=A0A9E8KJ92_9ALTE|nr:phosphoenolpyruvate--protein phosphotransferase [Alkalimarinus sediminis]UZW74781.1 phosphoenolpyruvate--protein phosphotransferase [Alkalimarinus sediminis]
MEPLQALRKIFQEAGELSSADELLHLIVTRVKEATHSDVCSIYLADEERDDWVLVATEGLSGEAIGSVRMRTGEGLVGYICKHQSLLNLEDGSKHPNYRYFPETGEEHFAGFLGVPVISFRRVIGVLVIQSYETRCFSAEEEAFLITIAAQLAGPLKTVLSQEKLAALTTEDSNDQIKVQGIKGSAGISIGKVHFLAPFNDLATVKDERCQHPDDEIIRFREALEDVKLEVQSGGDKLASSVPQDVHALFGVYLMMLDNDMIVKQTEERIHEGFTAASALRQTIDSHAQEFERMDDAYLRARAEDIRHIGARIYARMSAHHHIIDVPDEPVILVSKLLSITEIAQFPPDKLAGIVCMEGSSLSHTAVLANALGVTAVMGIGDIPRSKIDQQLAVMDGYRAQVIFNASEPLQLEYRRLIEQERKLVRGLEKLKELPAETTDHHRINLYANTGLLADISPGLERGAEGVGLYRSEIPFMLHDTFPTEDEQTQVYREVLQAYAPRSVYMRTLDIGGDKALPYFGFTEENPYLGWRGIRFTLDNGSIFLTQIRALLRASIGINNMKIMLPMVSRVEEVDAFRVLLDDALTQLREEGVEVKRPSIGIMIEVPSAMMILEQLAKRVDFISIGSNDLTQYLLAVDRNNPKVSSLYNFLNPAVICSIHRIVRIAHQHRLKVSLCGEMAADPAAVLLLIGMGIDTLSMSAFNLPKIKWVIRTISRTRAETLLTKVLALESEDSIREVLEAELIQAGLAGLIRAGS